MTKYQADYDDEIWAEWKKTVLRDVKLSDRIEELMLADLEGRIFDENENQIVISEDRSINPTADARGRVRVRSGFDDEIPAGATVELVVLDVVPDDSEEDGDA